MTKPKPKHPELLLLPNTLTEPFGIEFEKTIVGKSSESLKCNICSVPLEQQLKPHILCWIAVEAALSEIDISKPGQINPRTLCMTGLHFRLVRKWFCNLGTPTCTGKSKDRVGKWDAENEKERDPLQKASFSEHSRRTCLLWSSLLLFIVARKLYAILQRGIHPPCFFFFFTLMIRGCQAPCSLTSTALTFLGWNTSETSCIDVMDPDLGAWRLRRIVHSDIVHYLLDRLLHEIITPHLPTLGQTPSLLIETAHLVSCCLHFLRLGFPSHTPVTFLA